MQRLCFDKRSFIQPSIRLYNKLFFETIEVFEHHGGVELGLSLTNIIHTLKGGGEFEWQLPKSGKG